ncbi:MAG: glycosyltransferase family 4 protein [Bacteroidota bacterium]
MSASFNILQTCFSNSWGGLEIQALEVSLQLARRGHRVWLACRPGSRLSAEARAHQLDTLELEVKGYFHPVAIWQLRTVMRRQSIDIIHCQHSRDIATIVPATRLSGRPIPIVLSKRVGSYVMKKDLFHQFTYARVSKVLAVSEVIRRNVLNTTPMTPERVITLHDAIDTSTFSLERVERRRVRDEFSISDQTVLIGIVGRFSPGKGHEELLEAASILRKRHSNVHFMIVGEASHGEEAYMHGIRNLCTTLRLDDIITFTGFRKDVPNVMAAFDIFAFPSHAESFGVVLIEAMALERPVVSTNCDGVLDIVVDGETGLHVNPKSGNELADALERLIKYQTLREEMGKRGRKRVEEMFNQTKQMDKLEEIYSELLPTQ